MATFEDLCNIRGFMLQRIARYATSEETCYSGFHETFAASCNICGFMQQKSNATFAASCNIYGRHVTLQLLLNYSYTLGKAADARGLQASLYSPRRVEG